jgi:aspartate/methionine/tyrosine aminotransferase
VQRKPFFIVMSSSVGSFGSDRMRSIPGSVFALMDAAKCTARAAGLDIVDLSIGSSDLSPSQTILETLRISVLDGRCHRYPLPSDSIVLQQAAERYLRRRFGVHVDATSEILPCAGAQEALMQLLLASADPGDVVLLPDPCYAPYLGAAACAGLQVHSLASLSDGSPDLDSVPPEIAARAKVLLLNYPANPSSCTAAPGLFLAAAAWCSTRNVLLVHDAPYVELTWGGCDAPIALSARAFSPRCRIVELFSLSKSHSMGGFRIGFAAGDAGAIAALSRVQAVFGFGPPLAIQTAAAAALDLPDEVVRAGAAVFADRRDALVEALIRAGGWDIHRSVAQGGASMYVWARHPRIAAAGGSVSFAVSLASATGVAVAPGSAFGAQGEGFVRFALVLPPSQLTDATLRIQQWLDGKRPDPP